MAREQTRQVQRFGAGGLARQDRLENGLGLVQPTPFQVLRREAKRSRTVRLRGGLARSFCTLGHCRRGIGSP